MTLATTVTNQAKTVKNSESSFGPPNHDMPKLDMPKMEVPPAFRELADKGFAQARDTYEKAKAATEQATNQLKEAYTTAAKGATDYNIKVIEIACANTNTAVDNAFELLGVKSLTEIGFADRASSRLTPTVARSEVGESCKSEGKVTIHD